MKNKMNILVKIPSRHRPNRFFEVLDGYISKAKSKDIKYLISLDVNDELMNSEESKNKLSKYDNVIICYGTSSSKVQAYNRDIEKVKEWDIIIVASDDMICVKEGWDEIIKNEMKEFFPDMDGVIHHNDGYLRNKLNTLPIMGRTYYNRFNFIYNPEYTSLWCDNEFSEVSEKLGKQKYFDSVLFKHNHPSWNGKQEDDLMKRNQSYHERDKRIYDRRKLNNFGL